MAKKKTEVLEEDFGPEVPDWGVTELIRERREAEAALATEPDVIPEGDMLSEDLDDGLMKAQIERQEGLFRQHEEGSKKAFIEEMRQKAADLGASLPETYEKAQEFELASPRLEKRAELEDLQRQKILEESKAGIAGLRAYRRTVEPSKWRSFKKGAKALGGFAEKKLKPRPRTDLSKFYIPHTMKEYYVPGKQVRNLTTPPGQDSLIAEVTRPRLEKLRTAGAPPPSTAIKAPFRNVERQEGLGPALARLRQVSKFPGVDWAVYSEIHANGDVDTPSHVRNEVGRMGFSRKEINDSLGRLRKLGIIAPTGIKSNGEKELEVVGNEHNLGLEKSELSRRLNGHK